MQCVLTTSWLYTCAEPKSSSRLFLLIYNNSLSRLDSFTECLDLAEPKRSRTALEKVALFGEFLEVGLLKRIERLSGVCIGTELEVKG